MIFMGRNVRLGFGLKKAWRLKTRSELKKKMKRIHKFKIYFINKKTRSVEMTMTCKTKKMDDKNAMRCVKEELLKVNPKYDKAFEFITAWPKV